MPCAAFHFKLSNIHLSIYLKKKTKIFFYILSMCVHTMHLSRFIRKAIYTFHRYGFQSRHLFYCRRSCAIRTFFLCGFSRLFFDRNNSTLLIFTFRTKRVVAPKTMTTTTKLKVVWRPYNNLHPTSKFQNGIK